MNDAEFNAAALDEVIHGKLRLGMMAYLSSVSAASFTELKEKTGSSDGNLSVHMRKLEEASDNRRKAGEVVGGLLYFPRADGHAIYCVVSEKPLKLFHVPYGDAWTADPATIRGLRLADVQARLS